MGKFVVSALKYRPQSFADVVGQQAITQTLQNAIDLGKIAKAMLFCGPRGVGKTTCARIFAKKINSGNAAIDPNEDFAFNVFELDAASNNSVADIRSLIEQVRIPPQKGTYKVYIIDEVHMLSSAAFNAFLKTSSKIAIKVTRSINLSSLNSEKDSINAIFSITLIELKFYHHFCL